EPHAGTHQQHAREPRPAHAIERAAGEYRREGHLAGYTLACFLDERPGEAAWHARHRARHRRPSMGSARDAVKPWLPWRGTCRDGAPALEGIEPRERRVYIH